LKNGPSEVFIRLQPGSWVPLIWHSVTERGVLLQGKMVRTDDQGKDVTSTAGAYWYLPAGTIHGGSRCSTEGPCLIYETYDGAFDLTVVNPAEIEKKR
jgi:hypothetical protein